MPATEITRRRPRSSWQAIARAGRWAPIGRGRLLRTMPSFGHRLARPSLRRDRHHGQQIDDARTANTASSGRHLAGFFDVATATWLPCQPDIARLRAVTTADGTPMAACAALRHVGGQHAARTAVIPDSTTAADYRHRLSTSGQQAGERIDSSPTIIMRSPSAQVAAATIDRSIELATGQPHSSISAG